MIGHIKAPLNLHQQDDEMKQKLLKEANYMDGEWNFKGYYPFGCKMRPPCHTK